MSSRTQRTRIKILESARRLLVERGYHGVGLEEVARDAGVSRQAVYLHFKSKSDLLVEMAKYTDEMVETPELLRHAREAKTALDNFFEAGFGDPVHDRRGVRGQLGGDRG